MWSDQSSSMTSVRITTFLLKPPQITPFWVRTKLQRSFSPKAFTTFPFSLTKVPSFPTNRHSYPYSLSLLSFTIAERQNS